MKVVDSKFSPLMMKKLLLLGEKQGRVALTDLSLELGLSPEDTLVFLRTVFPGGIGAEIYYVEDRCMVDINASALEYMLPLSPSEWIGLHELLSRVSDSELAQHSGLSALKKKITENGPIRAVMELLQHLDQWDEQLSDEQQQILEQLDEAISVRRLVQLETVHGKVYSLYPCKNIHLEGKLSMIAEDSQDHCLMVIPINEILRAKFLEQGKGPRVTSFEIEEFINAIRSMNERETRLILKICDPQSVNLFPNYHFLGKPCMVTNPYGDLIWAAYVEPCDDLFEWLVSLGTHVEILDPVKFKDEFLRYCEEKLRKIA